MHLFALYLRPGRGVEAICPWEAAAGGQPGGAIDGEIVRRCHGKRRPVQVAEWATLRYSG